MKPNWFVGLPVDSEHWLSQALVDLPASCRGFHPADTHMTLAFLGAMPDGRRRDVEDVMNRIEFKPFAVRLGLIRPLPSARRCSALSFELDTGRARVNQLIAQWRGPLIAAAQGRPDQRPPLAHVTVARPKRGHGAEGRAAALAWSEQLVPPDIELPIDRLALYTWAADRAVRQFQIVAQKKFSSG